MNGTPLPPSLDTWTTFFLLAAGQGIFLAAALFFNKKGVHRANILLATFILLFAITLIDYVGFWTRYNQYASQLAGIYAHLVFLFGPILWWYFHEIDTTSSKPKNIIWHFLPALIYTGLEFLHWGRWFPSRQVYNNLEAILVIGHLSFYAYLMHQFLIQKIKRTGVTFSIQQKWYRTLWGLYLGFLGAYLFYYIMVRTPYFSVTQDYLIALAMTIFIYTVGYLGYRQPSIFSGQVLQQVFAPTTKYQNSSLTDSAATSLKSSLIEYMEQTKPYLNNELRMSSLAKELDVSTHHLSQVINEHLGKSFSDFINEYRVQAAMEMLIDPKRKEEFVINIAYAAGFNNKTSFNKAFKAQTGFSPTQFRKHHSIVA